MSNRLIKTKLPALWAFGVLALLFTHCLALNRAGGFHYDEAWAALFSHQIASEPGFWPIAAMSPYTSAWGHYVTAFFFKLLGPSLFAYRLSGIALVVAGVSLTSLALKNMKQALSAALLPWIIAFFSAAVINHRFAIEINTFHVFCFGLFAWGLSCAYSHTKRPWLSNLAILSAVVLGVTSHVLFLAPALACLILAFWNESFLSGNRQRWLAGASLALLAGFFLRIHLGIPEKDKSFALLLMASLSLLGVLFPKLASQTLQQVRKRAQLPLKLLFIAACAVSCFFLLFFSEGSWAAAFFNGGQSDIGVMIWPLSALGIAFAYSWTHLKSLINQDPNWKKAFGWAALTVILTTAMATKPAPRYFEIPFLFLAIAFALALANAPKRVAAIALSIWILSGALQLHFNYLKPALAGNIPERSFRFLFFRDNSSDTLLKQDIGRFLASSGCGFEKVSSSDMRILEPLRFLALGDWDVHGACRFGTQVIVERKSQYDPPSADRLGPFILYTPHHP